MDANTETVKERSLAWDNLITKDIIRHQKSAQTDTPATDAVATAEAGVEAAADWEERLAALLELADSRAKEEDRLVRRQQRENADRQRDVAQGQKKKAANQRQHQALVEKLNSVRVKLQLNNSKTTRKNFQSKKREIGAEKARAEDERNRLSKELEEITAKLSELTQEHREEKGRWQEELEELKKELDKVRREAEDGERAALRDQIRAVEAQRDLASERVRAWLMEASAYVSSLRPADRQEKADWADKEAAVRRNHAELQDCFQDNLAMLQKGHELESLPRINVPALPYIPTAELRLKHMISRLPAAPPPRFYRLPPPFHPPLPYYARPQFYMSPPPHAMARPPFIRPAPPPAYPIVPAQAPPPAYPIVPAQAPPPAYPIVPAQAPAAPSGTLDKVLDKLEARFPHCTRVQLTHLLQQVKSSRGTLAGMLFDEMAEKVGLLLTRVDTRAAPAAAPCKLCLMCQKSVDHESRYPLPCAHAIHKDCIRVWIQSSGRNSCPFCPNIFEKPTETFAEPLKAGETDAPSRSSSPLVLRRQKDPLSEPDG
nr:RING finger protein 214-like [Nerophis lumbriciformis]